MTNAYFCGAGEIATWAYADDTLARRLRKANYSGPWMWRLLAAFAFSGATVLFLVVRSTGSTTGDQWVPVAIIAGPLVCGTLAAVLVGADFWSRKVPGGTRVEGRFSRTWTGVCLGDHTQTLERRLITRVYVREGIFVLLCPAQHRGGPNKTMFVPAELIPPFIQQELLPGYPAVTDTGR